MIQTLSAQNILERVANTAKDAAESTVLNKTSETVSSKTDKLLSKKKKNKKEKKNKLFNTQKGSKTDHTLYSKFDFIPGNEIIYFRDFANESDGELPLGWNTSGSGAVVKFDDYEGKWLHLHQSSTFLSDNSKEFDENFTVEFDILFNDFGNEIINYPAFKFGFLSSGELQSTDNQLLQSPDMFFLTAVTTGVIHDGNGNSTLKLESLESRSMYFQSEQKSFPQIEDMIEKPVHVSMQIQKSRFRLWLDNEKVFDVPKAISVKYKLNQLYFEVSDNGYSNEEIGIFLSNIKIAKGVEDTRHKLMDEGKFVTNGIVFDVNKTTIKSESYPVLKEIAGVLKKYPDLQIQIVGHTDSDGDDKGNMELSEKRADAVKKFLQEEFEIQSERIETSGKGESEPIAENTTSEGKAKNRRVEFIKK